MYLISSLIKKNMYFYLIALIFCVATFIGCSNDDVASKNKADFSDRGYKSTEHLVSADWLNDKLENEKLILIDVRSEEDYIAGHIPGAIHVNPKTAFQQEDNRGVAGMLPPKEHVELVLSSIGASADSEIVIYDGIKSLWASRGLWALEVYGHEKTALLDGSWTLWDNKGLPASTEIPTVIGTDYKFKGDPNTNLIAGYEEVLESIGDTEKLVCDTRSPEEYAGRDVRAERGGHIEGSKNVNWVSNANADGEFLSYDELSKIYSDAGFDKDQTIFTLCQTAVRATHTWFVLSELLGYENVKVYDGSWIEWGNRSDLPIQN